MRRASWGLFAILALALALRVGLALALGRGEGQRSYEHGEIARHLVAGEGFRVTFLGQEGPTSQQAPFYPALLAVAFWLGGVDSPAGLWGVTMLQCLAGTGLVAGVYALARGLFPSRPWAATIAATGAAVYPPHVYAVTHYQVALWAALVVTLLFAVAVSQRWRGTAQGAIAVGALVGAATLIDPILALSGPAAAWLVSRGAGGARVGAMAERGPLRRRLVRVGASGLVALFVVAPWVARNYAVHGELVLVKSTFGYALWQGNNPASFGTDKIPKAAAEAMRRDHDGSLASMDRALWNARHETLYIDDVLLKPGGYREFEGLTEPARSRLLGQRATEFMRDQPRSYLRLCLLRLKYFLLWDETNPKAAHPVYRASSLAWLAFTAAGLLATRGWWRSGWPLWSFCLTMVVFHSLTIYSARFRFPVEPITFAFAGLAVAGLISTLLRRGKSADGDESSATPQRGDGERTAGRAEAA